MALRILAYIWMVAPSKFSVGLSNRVNGGGPLDAEHVVVCRQGFDYARFEPKTSILSFKFVRQLRNSTIDRRKR